MSYLDHLLQGYTGDDCGSCAAGYYSVNRACLLVPELYRQAYNQTTIAVATSPDGVQTAGLAGTLSTRVAAIAGGVGGFVALVLGKQAVVAASVVDLRSHLWPSM